MWKFVLLLMIVSIVFIECKPSSWYYTDGNYAVEDRKFSNLLDSLGGQHNNLWYDEFLDDDYDLFEFPETPSFPEVQAYGSKHGPVNEKREENLGQFLEDVFGADASEEYSEKAKDLVPFVQKVIVDTKSTAKNIAKAEHKKALLETSSNDGDMEDIVRREFSAFEPENEGEQDLIPRGTTASSARSLDDILDELFAGGETTESSLDHFLQEHRTDPTPTDVYGATSTPKLTPRSIDDILNELFTPTENTKVVEEDDHVNIEDHVRETFAAFEPMAGDNVMRSPWDRQMHELFGSGERHDIEGSDTRKLWSKSRHPLYHNNKDVGRVKVNNGNIDDIMNELFNTPGAKSEPKSEPESAEERQDPFHNPSIPATVSTTNDPRKSDDGSFEDNVFFEAWKKNIQETVENHDIGFQFPNHFVEDDNSLDKPPNVQLIPAEMDTFHLMTVPDPCTGHGLIEDLDHLSKLLSTFLGKGSDAEGEERRSGDGINYEPLSSPNAETEWISHPRSNLDHPHYSSKYDKYFSKHEAHLRSRRHQA